jgi:hypothetical protein
MSLEKVLQDALLMPCGMVLRLDEPQQARTMRRKLYALREQLRKHGEQAYDVLSFITKPYAQVWIIKREMLAGYDNTPSFSTRPLRFDELPPQIMARGASRVGKMHLN